MPDARASLLSRSGDLPNFTTLGRGCAVRQRTTMLFVVPSWRYGPRVITGGDFACGTVRTFVFTSFQKSGMPLASWSSSALSSQRGKDSDSIFGNVFVSQVGRRVFDGGLISQSGHRSMVMVGKVFVSHGRNSLVSHARVSLSFFNCFASASSAAWR